MLGPKIELDKALECHRIACEMNSTYANARSNMLRDGDALCPTACAGGC